MSSEPIACSLTADQLRRGAADLLPGLVAEARETEWLAEGIAMTFSGEPGCLARISDVIERERGCCSFLTFELLIVAGSGPIRLEVSGPPGTRRLLESLSIVAASGSE